jgi:dethiobiotin synthetase
VIRLVLIGTGTGIGKTHAGVALVSALFAAGVEVAGLKPIESGVSTGLTDASALAAAGSFGVNQALYAFVEPVSPHLAARREGVTIDLSRVQAWVDAHAAQVLVIETAGALLSPLGPGLTNLDLARALRPDVLVLAAPDRLGVLHEVTSAMHVLRTLGGDMPAPMLLLQPPAAPDSSTGTNAAELVLLGIHPAPHAFPRAASTAEETLSAARALLVAARVLS